MAYVLTLVYVVLLADRVRVNFVHAGVDEANLELIPICFQYRETMDWLPEECPRISLQRPQPSSRSSRDEEVHSCLGLQMLHVMVVTGQVHIDTIPK